MTRLSGTGMCQNTGWQGLEKLGAGQGLWTFSWRCQQPLLRCKRTFCALNALEGYFFSTPPPRSQGVCEDEGLEWKGMSPVRVTHGDSEGTHRNPWLCHNPPFPAAVAVPICSKNKICYFKALFPFQESSSSSSGRWEFTPESK